MSLFKTATDALTVATDVATDATAEAGFDLWAWLMEWGPMLMQIGLIIALIYNGWQRNVVKSGILALMCVVTFILGW